MLSSALRIAYYQQRVSKNTMSRKVAPSTDKICREDFPEALFKALYKSQ